MIRMKIAFVLRMIDDFSGMCIHEKVFTFVANGRAVHPVEKKEGLYVFLEPYETCTIYVDGKTTDELTITRDDCKNNW